MCKKIISAFLVLLTGCSCGVFSTGCDVKTAKNVLYQVTPNADMLMNCYIIKTKSNKLIVIDGGGAGSPAANGYLYLDDMDLS